MRSASTYKEQHTHHINMQQPLNDEDHTIIPIPDDISTLPAPDSPVCDFIPLGSPHVRDNPASAPTHGYNLRRCRMLPEWFTPSEANGYSAADLIMADNSDDSYESCSSDSVNTVESDGFLPSTADDEDYVPGVTSSDDDNELDSLLLSDDDEEV